MSIRNEAEKASEIPPPVAVVQLATGYMLAQAVYVAAKIGIADLVAEGPKSATELAATTGVDPSSLYRLLRALARHGVFREVNQARFEQSPLSACLQDDIPGSLRASVILWNEEQYRAWGELSGSVRTGRSAFERIFGSAWVTYYQHGEAEAAEIFNSAMSGWTAQIAAALVQAYDFAPFEQIVDVGGGHGVLLTSILEAFPQARGVVFDLEEVVRGADRQIKAAGLAARCDTAAGDFFAAVHSGADAYILSQVLHDWDDAQCVAILANCRQAMRDNGRLLVVEMVIGPEADSSLATLSDLHMMVVTGGRERTEAEYTALFARAGFRLRRIIPTLSPARIMEAAPVA